MIDPDTVSRRLLDRFSSMSQGEFLEVVQRYSPQLLEAESQAGVQLLDDKIGGAKLTQLKLLQPQPTRLPLDAYLACALSGLNPEQRQLVFQLSDVISLICGDHQINLYEPRKKTDPVHHADVPDAEVFTIDRDRVLASDLVIHLTHYPSTGSGEELDFAYNALVPIILVSHSDTRVSRMITGIPAFKIQLTYTEPEDLRALLDNCLLEVRPILEERKIAFSEYQVNVVGDRIRILRENLGLSRDEVAAHVPLLTVDTLRHIEESPDQLSNPSLIQLRQIATILKTTVADLVEPDLGDRLVVALEEWAANRTTAARFGGGLSPKDRNRLVRRVLLRVIDSLETE